MNVRGIGEKKLPQLKPQADRSSPRKPTTRTAVTWKARPLRAAGRSGQNTDWERQWLLVVGVVFVSAWSSPSARPLCRSPSPGSTIIRAMGATRYISARLQRGRMETIMR